MKPWEESLPFHLVNIYHHCRRNSEFCCAMLIGPIIVHLSPKFPTVYPLFLLFS